MAKFKLTPGTDGIYSTYAAMVEYHAHPHRRSLVEG